MRRADQAQDTETRGAAGRQCPAATAVLLTTSFGNRREAPAAQRGDLRARVSAPRRTRRRGRTVLLHDRLLSREHLRITRTPRATRSRTSRSTNGTFLDGPRLERPTRLGREPWSCSETRSRLLRRSPTPSWRPCSRRRRRLRSRSRPFAALARRTRGCASWPAPMPSSCWSVRRASARRSVPAPSTGPPGARGVSWPSTARRCRRRWSRASCSDISPAPFDGQGTQAGTGGGSRRGNPAARRRSARWLPSCRRNLPLSSGPHLQPPRRGELARSTSGCSRPTTRAGDRRWEPGPSPRPGRTPGAEPIAILPLRKRPEEILPWWRTSPRGRCARSSPPRSGRCAFTVGPSTSASWRRPSPTPWR